MARHAVLILHIAREQTDRGETPAPAGEVIDIGNRHFDMRDSSRFLREYIESAECGDEYHEACQRIFRQRFVKCGNSASRERYKNIPAEKNKPLCTISGTRNERAARSRHAGPINDPAIAGAGSAISTAAN
jgi:hypothetical protein